MTYRLAKKRTLQKAGFVHVSGWVAQEDAQQIQATIDAAKPQVLVALENQEKGKT
jgi:polynucleotide 5'-kinase involved in rRNA processing